MKHYIVSTKDALAFTESHLKSKVNGFEALSGGEWSAAFGYTLRCNEYVIRFAKLKEDYEKDFIASTYTNNTVCIPEVYEIGEAFEGYFAISERMHGLFFDELNGMQMKNALPSLFEVLDSLRNINISDTTGYGWWQSNNVGSASTWQQYLLDTFDDQPSSKIYGWRKKLSLYPAFAKPFNYNVSVFKKLVSGMPSERYLIHTDLLNRNVLVKDERIEAIIDWGNSIYGDFLYDIACLLFWWPYYPQWGEINIKQLVLDHYKNIGLNIPNIETRLLCYQIHIGLDAQKYNAFTERWEDFAQNSRQTQKLIESINDL